MLLTNGVCNLALTLNQTDPLFGQSSLIVSIVPISCWNDGIGWPAVLFLPFLVTKTVVYELIPKKSEVPRILSISRSEKCGNRDLLNPCSLLSAATRSIITLG
jgi:hypothetical protein